GGGPVAGASRTPAKPAAQRVAPSVARRPHYFATSENESPALAGFLSATRGLEPRTPSLQVRGHGCPGGRGSSEIPGAHLIRNPCYPLRCPCEVCVFKSENCRDEHRWRCGSSPSRGRVPRPCEPAILVATLLMLPVLWEVRSSGVAVGTVALIEGASFGRRAGRSLPSRRVL